MKHLMIFAVGPVQDFIATARRSRDLWYGSWMLSELAKAAALQVGKLSPPGELIFPYPSKSEALQPASEFHAPNKVVAIIEGDPKLVGGTIQEAVKARLDELWANASGHVKGEIDEALAQKQIDDLLEFYWVSVPFDKPYDKIRDAAECLFAARKTTRNFDQASGKSIPKSSLDGARESVIAKNEYPERNDPAEVKWKKAERLYKKYHARRGEQLSGVDLLKRLGDPENAPKFKSTSDMAAIPFIARIKNGSKLLDDIKALLPPDHDTLDGAEEGLVFERRFEDAFPVQELSPQTRKDYQALFEKLPQPNPYYALLAADGDNMGIVIDAQTDVPTHQRLSQALGDFAATVTGLVHANRGILIYTGGDDVLAYLPLHTALGFAQQIEERFKEKLQDFKTKDGISPSLSVGIAVIHHLEPLADALELARSAEKEAKSVPGKNGLAIIASKRGGADRTIAGKFASLHERLTELIHFSESDAISAGAAYELLKLHRDLSKTGIPPEGLAKEALRIIGRKREAGGSEDIKPEIRDAFKNWIAQQKIPLNELAQEMVAARMFATSEEAK